jgi:N-methylhydantoinase A/oxoprolinase/acetone carboxylase beta subunit
MAADALPSLPRRLAGGAVAGPAVVAEPDCTIWVADGWVARPGAAGALVMERRAG